MIISNSVEETIAAGVTVAESMSDGDVIALRGDLGAGKTHFVKGIAQGLGYKGDVTSPTFGLVHEYRGGRLVCFHFDFYRLEQEKELGALGFQDYLDEVESVCVIEWADKFPEALPQALLRVEIKMPSASVREIRIEKRL